MKNCDRIVKMFYSYLGENLRRTEREIIDVHLASCGSCRARLKRARRLKSDLRNLPKYKTSPTFNAVLRARIRSEAHQRPAGVVGRTANWAWQIPAYSAAALLFIGIGFVLQRSLENEINPGFSSLANMEQVEIISLQELESVPAGTVKKSYPRMKNYVKGSVPLYKILQESKQSYPYQTGTLDRIDRDSTKYRNNYRSYSTLPIQQANAPVKF